MKAALIIFTFIVQFSVFGENFRYNAIIEREADYHNVDADLIKAMIRQESAYRKKAVSHKGAQGLMQLMPATAKRFYVTDSFDPDQNIRGGTTYMAWLLKRFKGDVSLALAGYNAGEGAVDKYNGIPPYKETRNYVRVIMRHWLRIKKSKNKNKNSKAMKEILRLAYKKQVKRKTQKIKNLASGGEKRRTSVKKKNLDLAKVNNKDSTRYFIQTAGRSTRIKSITTAKASAPMSGYSRIQARLN